MLKRNLAICMATTMSLALYVSAANANVSPQTSTKFSTRSSQLPPVSSPLPLSKNTLAPFAHILFCTSNPGECIVSDGAKTVTLSANNWRTLTRVNRGINRAIQPEHDLVSSGMKDVWSLKPRSGDCEDYALTKRSQLIKLGLPASALSVAIVHSTTAGHHAVLVVRTDRGDYVLDNLREEILPWKQVGYKWNKVQTPENPMLWASL